MHKLESLQAWTNGRQLAREAYGLTLTAPLRQHFGLADQIRRAAAAVPANIAEGYALVTRPQFLRCLRIALGSAAELRTHLDLVVDLGLLEGGAISAVRARCDREVGLLIGLMRSLDGRGP